MTSLAPNPRAHEGRAALSAVDSGPAGAACWPPSPIPFSLNSVRGERWSSGVRGERSIMRSPASARSYGVIANARHRTISSLGLAERPARAAWAALRLLAGACQFARTPLVAEVPGSSGETGRSSGIRLHDRGDISSAHLALRAAQIAPRREQSRFHNGQLCAWPFTNKSSLRPRDCCGQQKVKRAETMHSTSASGVQSCAHGEYCCDARMELGFYASATLAVAHFNSIVTSETCAAPWSLPARRRSAPAP